MFVPLHPRGLFALAAVTVLGALDRTDAPAQRPGTISPHSLGAVVATAPGTFISIRPQVIGLSDGRAVVADAGRHLVLLFDSTFAKPVVVLDTTPGKLTTFSAQSFLIPFRGDSTLFFDRTAGVLVVIDPQGKLTRTMAPPSTGRTSVTMIGGSPLITGFTTPVGGPMASPALGLIYRIGATSPLPPRMDPGTAGLVVRSADSTFLVRMDFATRKVDTLAKIASGNSSLRTYSANGGMSMTTGLIQFNFYDDAVVTTDGSMAIFHAQEYRLEWVNPDGTRSSGPRLNYPWRRITDEDRQRIVDSVNARRKYVFDSSMAKRAADSALTGSVPTVSSTSIMGDGARVVRQVPVAAPRPPAFITGAEVPDFRPPTASLPLLADGDNNVWIRAIPAQPDTAGVIWDVINRKGELIDRVVIPIGRTIAGFGRGGFVYLTARDGGNTILQKVRVKK